jgi:sarcosine oxidase subunit gamma
VSDPQNELALKRNGLTISKREDVAVTHVALRRGKRSDLESRASAVLGVSLPFTPRVVEGSGKMVVWAGPEQWLVIEPRSAGRDPSVELAEAFKGAASIVDVGDSRVIFRVEGPKATEVLAPSMAIDFHDQVFKPGDVAITHASHLGAMVWRLPNGSGYDFACARTYAVAFSEWLAYACGKSMVFA